MTCVDAQPLLHAYLDGELDLTASLGIEQHMEACRECSTEYRKLELLRAEIADADLDFASDAVLRRLRASIVPKDRRFAWRGPAFLAAAAAVLVVAFLLPGRRSTDREIVDSHLRSVLGDHLIDIPSSDRHTVKPWFQGKLDFAPPVPDLTAEGFILVGGRLDVIDTRKVAALVYKRREHIINLWISPGDVLPEETEIGGYHLVSWTKNGLSYRAVSDLDVAELRTFEDAIRNR